MVEVMVVVVVGVVIVVVDVVDIVVGSHKPHNPGQNVSICGITHCATVNESQLLGSFSHDNVSHTGKN